MKKNPTKKQLAAFEKELERASRAVHEQLISVTTFIVDNHVDDGISDESYNAIADTIYGLIYERLPAPVEAAPGPAAE